jgi:hypothetical protein
MNLAQQTTKRTRKYGQDCDESALRYNLVALNAIVLLDLMAKLTRQVIFKPKSTFFSLKLVLFYLEHLGTL